MKVRSIASATKQDNDCTTLSLIYGLRPADANDVEQFNLPLFATVASVLQSNETPLPDKLSLCGNDSQKPKSSKTLGGDALREMAFPNTFTTRLSNICNSRIQRLSGWLWLELAGLG